MGKDTLLKDEWWEIAITDGRDGFWASDWFELIEEMDDLQPASTEDTSADSSESVVNVIVNGTKLGTILCYTMEEEGDEDDDVFDPDWEPIELASLRAFAIEGQRDPMREVMNRVAEELNEDLVDCRGESYSGTDPVKSVFTSARNISPKVPKAPETLLIPFEETLEQLTSIFSDPFPKEGACLPAGSVRIEDTTTAILKSGFTDEDLHWKRMPDCDSTRESKSSRHLYRSVEATFPKEYDSSDSDDILEIMDNRLKIHKLADGLLRLETNTLSHPYLCCLSTFHRHLCYSLVLCERYGEKHPYLEKVKQCWAAGGIPCGMDGYVPDTWPDGNLLFYWTRDYDPPIES